jgi:protease II
MLVDLDANNGGSGSSSKSSPGLPAVPNGPPLGDVHSCEWGGETAASEGHYILYYTVPDALGRPAQVRRVQLQRTAQGLTAQRSQLLYAEADDAYFVDVGRTKDHAFMTVHCNSKLSSEVRLLPGKAADANAHSLKLVRPRQRGVEYYVDHCRGALYVITNAVSSSSSSSAQSTATTDSAASDSAAAVTGEYRLAVMPVAAVFGSDADRSAVRTMNTSAEAAVTANTNSSEHKYAAVPWTDVLVPTAGARIEDMDMFRNHIALYEAHSSGAPRLRILPLAADGSVVATSTSYNSTSASSTSSTRSGYYVNFNELQFGESPAVLQPGANQHYDSSAVRFTLSSVLQPAAVYDYDAAQQQLQCLATVSVPPAPLLTASGGVGNGCFNAAQYVCKRLSAVSADGTAVPITVAHARE